MLLTEKIIYFGQNLIHIFGISRLYHLGIWIIREMRLPHGDWKGANLGMKDDKQNFCKNQKSHRSKATKIIVSWIYYELHL